MANASRKMGKQWEHAQTIASKMRQYLIHTQQANNAAMEYALMEKALHHARLIALALQRAAPQINTIVSQRIRTATLARARMDAILIQTDARTDARQAAEFALRIPTIITRVHKIAALLYARTVVPITLQDALQDANPRFRLLCAAMARAKALKHLHHARLTADQQQQRL